LHLQPSFPPLSTPAEEPSSSKQVKRGQLSMGNLIQPLFFQRFCEVIS
jgi:hypothetical protein